MFRLVISVILLTLTVICAGVIVADHSAAAERVLDLELAGDVAFGFNFTLVASCAILAGLRAQLINQVKLSQQIILGFFFYGWRNSLYSELTGYIQSMLRPRNRDKVLGLFIFAGDVLPFCGGNRLQWM